MLVSSSSSILFRVQKECAKFVFIGPRKRLVLAKVRRNSVCGEGQSIEMKGDDDDDL